MHDSEYQMSCTSRPFRPSRSSHATVLAAPSNLCWFSRFAGVTALLAVCGGMCNLAAAEQPAGTPPTPAPIEPGRPIINRPKQPAAMPQPARPEGEVAQPPAQVPDATPRPVMPTGTSSTVTAKPSVPIGVAGTYPVSRFLIRYAGSPGGQLPPEDLIMDAVVALEYDGVAYSPARPNSPRDATDTSVIRSIADLNTVPGNYTPAAISAISSAIVRKLNDSGFVAIFVLPASEDIDDTGRDLRGDRREMTLLLFAGKVRSVTATVVDENGDKIPDSPVGARAVANTPIAPGSFVDKSKLDEHLARISRHPGRRADAAISAAAESGASPFDVDLNYNIAQAKPWSVYANISNTGTEQTSNWRQRLGVSHTNLSGNDDVLQIDIVTASFDQSTAVFGSYELPVYGDFLRAKVLAGWNQYTASDVGIALGSLEGEGYNVGGELIWQAIVKPRYEVDLYMGVRYENTEVSNQTIPGFPIEGSAGFTLLSGGVRGNYRSDLASTTSAGIGFDSAVAASEQAEIDNLGRFDPDRKFTQFKGNVDHSFYIEPLFLGQQAGTLAHEIYGSIRGTSAMGSRVVPIFQQVGGGFYTVRGYDESQFAGDNALFATAEYRLHIPRLYSISAQPGELFGSPFRWRPQETMGTADWDLIFRTFIDAAHISNNDRKVFESDADLVGAGFGLEFQMKRNLFIRADWGFVLRGTNDASGNPTSSSGDNRLHFSATIAF